ncbi:MULTISPECIES: ogr/Delta-like zinc finger family protein [Xanthomonas]|uniref:ogr/Delta-like zinc finger family protein n=1 Tax=Xanthomonas TaxID=338 RepID=UPI001C44EF14|nr:ogr/Delta-like zinc finger family protein [Xanthomonas euvesicatoria]MBV6864064.1 ogr/Delta-like zinc finger family protein [Xanthomonas campestris pv. blepharidis]
MFGRKKIVFRCEACSARLIKRTSVLAHKFLRHDSYVCENPMCGATYTGHSELTGIASPSGVPTAHSELPPTPAYQRAQALQAYRESLGDRQLDLIPMGGEQFFPHL